jgi:hypothetical protein
MTMFDTVTMIMLTIPDIPNTNGKMPMGKSKTEYSIDCTAAYFVGPPLEGNKRKPALE